MQFFFVRLKKTQIASTSKIKIMHECVYNSAIFVEWLQHSTLLSYLRGKYLTTKCVYNNGSFYKGTSHDAHFYEKARDQTQALFAK